MKIGHQLDGNLANEATWKQKRFNSAYKPYSNHGTWLVVQSACDGHTRLDQVYSWSTCTTQSQPSMFITELRQEKSPVKTPSLRCRLLKVGGSSFATSFSVTKQLISTLSQW